jgi:hypothetical protein
MLAFCLMFSSLAQAKKLNPADYPLRIHLYSHSGHSHYYHGMLDYSEGEGRANLYENGVPTAFDYNYRCGDRMQNSIGYETYMARWHKDGRSLEILIPVMGKPDGAETCELNVNMKPGMAYFKHNGLVNEEPAEVFKKWMEKVQYDPEHGMNMPVRPGSENGTAKEE